MKNKLSMIIVLLLSVVAYFNSNTKNHNPSTSNPQAYSSTLTNAINNKKSDVIVQTKATVIKILKDDLEGHKHQKFIVKIPTGQTILVAHNIDLAPRIPNLKKGSHIELKGEYEWNNKGGIIHWTHDDPNNHHTHGWIKFNNKLYK